MKRMQSAGELTHGKKYVCGRLHPESDTWEVWDVLDWDEEGQVLYCVNSLFDEGEPFAKFVFVYELPSLLKPKGT